MPTGPSLSLLILGSSRRRRCPTLTTLEPQVHFKSSGRGRSWPGGQPGPAPSWSGRRHSGVPGRWPRAGTGLGRARGGAVAALGADVDDPRLAVAGAAAVHLEQCRGGHQVTELGVAVSPGIEVRALVGDDVAHGGQGGPAVVVGGRLYRVAQLVDQRPVRFELGRGGTRDRFA